MNPPIPEDQAAAIVAAVEKFATGATMIEVAAALAPTPRERTVQRWLSILVQQKRLIRSGRTRGSRYKIPPREALEESCSGPSKAAQAIHVLITQPLAERMPADYRRVILERYRPNETYYLPADVRARIAASGDGGAWRQKPAFDAVLTALASRCLSLEGAMDPSRAAQAVAGLRRAGGAPSLLTQPLSDADVTGWLSQPERPGARWEAQLLWGVRAGFVELVNASPTLTVTPSLLAHVYQQVTSRLDGPTSALRSQFAAVRPPSSVVGAPSAAVRLPTPAPSPLRRAVLTLPDTVYCPPSDPLLIEPCFDQVLQKAAAITDPVERAFWVLVHLLYLLPFGTLNATMALLMMNVPLLTAGLPPMTFAGVSGSDLLAGIRGVWELGRTDLLADAGLRVSAQT